MKIAVSSRCKAVQHSYLRLIDSCITQLKAQGLSRTCNGSNEDGKKKVQPYSGATTSESSGIESVRCAVALLR